MPLLALQQLPLTVDPEARTVGPIRWSRGPGAPNLSSPQLQGTDKERHDDLEELPVVLACSRIDRARNLPGNIHVATSLGHFRVVKGEEFDEPVYYLQGMYGVKLKQAYAGEELAAFGFKVEETEQ